MEGNQGKKGIKERGKKKRKKDNFCNLKRKNIYGNGLMKKNEMGKRKWNFQQIKRKRTIH